MYTLLTYLVTYLYLLHLSIYIYISAYMYCARIMLSFSYRR